MQDSSIMTKHIASEVFEIEYIVVNFDVVANNVAHLDPLFQLDANARRFTLSSNASYADLTSKIVANPEDFQFWAGSRAKGPQELVVSPASATELSQLPGELIYVQPMPEKHIVQEDLILVFVMFYFREAGKHPLQFIMSTTVKPTAAISSIYRKVNDLILCESEEFHAYSADLNLGFRRRIRHGSLFNTIATNSAAYLILEAPTGTYLLGHFPMCHPSPSGRTRYYLDAVDDLAGQDFPAFMDFFERPLTCHISSLSEKDVFDVRIPRELPLPRAKQYLARLLGMEYEEDANVLVLFHRGSPNPIPDSACETLGGLLRSLSSHDPTIFAQLMTLAADVDSLRLVTVLVSTASYVISGQFHAISTKGVTFGDMFHLACEYGFLNRTHGPFLRYGFQTRKDEIAGTAEPTDFLDATANIIRLEITPLDQQRGSKRTEKLCQVLLLKRKMKGHIRRLAYPFLFKLIPFERADLFKVRLQENFRVSGEKLTGAVIWIDAGPDARRDIMGDEVLYDIVASQQVVFVELTRGPDPTKMPALTIK
jgi:hypothetical protein